MHIRGDPVAEPYSARTDLARGIETCYAAIRERVAQGGKPWQPPEAKPHGEPSWAGPSCRPNPTRKSGSTFG